MDIPAFAVVITGPAYLDDRDCYRGSSKTIVSRHLTRKEALRAAEDAVRYSPETVYDVEVKLIRPDVMDSEHVDILPDGESRLDGSWLD